MNEYQVILFDGVCNLCNGSVNFIIDHDPRSRFKFATLQSEAGQDLLQKFNLDQQRYDSIILIDNDRFFTKSTAALHIARKLSGFWPIIFYAFIWLPVFIRNFFYDIVAKNRYRFFGKSDTCRLPTPALQARFL